MMPFSTIEFYLYHHVISTGPVTSHRPWTLFIKAYSAIDCVPHVLAGKLFFIVDVTFAHLTNSNRPFLEQNTIDAYVHYI